MALWDDARLLIDGRLVEAAGGRRFENLNPATEEVIGQVPDASLEDADRAIAAARRLAELEPDDPLSHTNLSILYQSKGMIREAEDEKALAMRLQMRSGT